MKTSEWIRYRDGLWIPQRKRTYLYWFKFLQEAEQAAEYNVNWSKYRGWGGPNVILGQKFDMWWEERWEKLFAVKTRGASKAEQRFPLSTSQPKTEAIRLSLLVWQNRNTPADLTPSDDFRITQTNRNRKSIPRRGGNTLSIAKKIIETEKRRATPLAGIDPTRINQDGTIENEIQSRVGRYLRNAKKTLANVCEGSFP
jgi:hypothetical protein